MPETERARAGGGEGMNDLGPEEKQEQQQQGLSRRPFAPLRQSGLVARCLHARALQWLWPLLLLRVARLPPGLATLLCLLRALQVRDAA